MATVRFSKQLINDIDRAAHAKMTPMVDAANAQTPRDSWGQFIYDTLFREDRPALAQLPHYWFKSVGQLTVSNVGALSLARPITFDLVGPMPWPHHPPQTPLATARSYASPPLLALSDHPVWEDFASEAKAYHNRIVAAWTKRNDFVEDVKKLCLSYSTLAPALKAWPPLWDLLDGDVKDRHRAVTTRGAKAEADHGVDLDQITATLTAAKLRL